MVKGYLKLARKCSYSGSFSEKSTLTININTFRNLLNNMTRLAALLLAISLAAAAAAAAVTRDEPTDVGIFKRTV